MVFERIVKIISKQFHVKEENITLETSFKDDLNADSVDLVGLVMTLEEEFDSEVEDEEIENIKTVGDAVEYIRKITGLD